MEQKTISIFDIVGGKAAVSTEDGDRVFETLSKFLDNNYKVILDFTNIETLITTFLNASIGQLYSKYDSPFLLERLSVNGIQPEDRDRLIKTIERAKEYFKDKVNFDKDVGEAFEGE